jgi:hypothetical protein
VKHIAGQAAYQLAVMYTLVFHAPALLGIPDHSAVAGPSEHYTLVFNAFVFMQLFNQLNSRKILDSTHVWEGLGQARWFQGILGCELLLQVLIIQARTRACAACRQRHAAQAFAARSCSHRKPSTRGSPCDVPMPGARCALPHRSHSLPGPLLWLQYGGEWFNTHPLDVREWAVCVGLGAASLLLREVLIRIPYGR